MSQLADHPADSRLAGDLQPDSGKPALSEQSLSQKAPRPAFAWPATWIVLFTLCAILNAAMVFAYHGTRGFFLTAVALLVCLYAAVADAFAGRIPNFLTYGAILTGLIMNSAVPLLQRFHADAAVVWLGSPGPAASWIGFGVCVGIAALCVLVMLFLPALQGMNGGDLKLLAALGALLGLLELGNVLMVALFLAMIYSVINLLFVGRLTIALRIAATQLMELLYLRRINVAMPDDPAPMNPSHFPMAIPLAIGLIYVQYWHLHFGSSLL